jgi:hypothetical protein
VVVVHRFLLRGLVVLAALVLAAPAGAAVTRKKSMWGPAEIGGVSQFPVYAELGVGIWQTALPWADAAPSRPASPRDPGDPAYRWPASLDAAIADASSHGIEVSAMLIGTPAWANGGRDRRWAPNRAGDFADFAEAAARRYPGIRHWVIWGEPTKASNFQPLAGDHGRPLRGKKLRGPRSYAAMLDAAYVALKRVSRRNVVIGGNTYTVGTVAPERWIRALRLPNGRRPRMDLWGHNPFTLRSPRLSRQALGNGYADFSDLDTLARWLDSAFPGRRLGIFISELTLPTDHENWEFNFYVDRATQADWITRMLKIVRGWDRLYTFGYLGLYDDAPRADGKQVERGLIQLDGTRKPAFAAFRDG